MEENIIQVKIIAYNEIGEKVEFVIENDDLKDYIPLIKKDINDKKLIYK